MAIPNTGPRLAPNRFGVYEIRWSVQGRSHRKTTHTTNLEQAKAALGKFLTQAVQAPTAPTVADCLAAYLREHAEPHAAAASRQQQAAARLSEAFGARLVTQLDAAAILAYRAQRRAGAGGRRGVKDGTLRRELGVLVTALRYAVRNKRMAAGDMPYIPLPEAPAPNDLWLTEDEQALLLRQAALLPRELHWFCEIALGTAARRAAIEKLDWSQVDMAAMLIHFRPTGSRQTAKRRVPVPMSSRLYALLSTVPEPERRGPALGTTRDLYKPFISFAKELAAQTGQTKFARVTPHTLRHTWATLAARRGVDMPQIAGVMGDTVATVTKVYLHHSPDYLRKAVES